ncbi:MAG TPA: hypothetical protein VHG09_13815 [Longimicrobiales bacterium]|nr:hypothetical protein [Longimicrobiales bacterium]
MKNLILALALTAGCALGASAQAPEQQMQRSIEQARRSGVPVELLESKIAEGRAKGIPESRIAAAIERRLHALQRVQSLVEREHGLTTDELGVAADALQSGVSDAALRALARTAPSERRGVAIATLTQLVQLGQASDVALRSVTAAMSRGPEALMGLPAQAAEAAARRGPPPGVRGQGNQGRGGPPDGVPGRKPGGGSL